jgi:hypothetical protein
VQLGLAASEGPGRRVELLRKSGHERLEARRLRCCRLSIYSRMLRSCSVRGLVVLHSQHGAARFFGISTEGR